MQIERYSKLVVINVLTISRVGLVLYGFLYPSDLFFFFISIWASMSDFLDGFLARRFNLITKFGEQLDQISDKVFHFGMFFILLNSKLIHPYFFLLFLIREFLILALRYLNISGKSSNFLGKLKTLLSYGFIVLLFAKKVFAPTDIFMETPMVWIFELVILLISYFSMALSLKKSSK